MKTAIRKKILVIDDEQVIREVLGRFLKAEGYDVVTAEDGLRGLELARSLAPDLVIADIRMPKCNGHELCAVLKQSELTKHIPILFLTGQGLMDDLEKAAAEGAAGYLIKPVDFSRLIEKIQSLLIAPAH